VLPLKGETREPVSFLASSANEWWGAPSPDGRYVAYVSDESGRHQVYVTTFPTPSGKWQVSVDGGVWPRWRADGREIFYATENAILSVEADTTSTLKLSPPRVLFRREPTGFPFPWPDGFDVSADGQRFVLLRSAFKEGEKAEVPTITVVQSWFTEFRPGR
jgi:dipeptidyl aminopeptidase/acylaminoacyl peptidase